MLLLCVDQVSGLLFAGQSAPYTQLPSSTFLTPCVLVPPGRQASELVASSPDFNIHRWVFQEQLFDPLTRLRRGRLWQPCTAGGGQPSLVGVAPSVEHMLAVGATGKVQRQVYQYEPARDLWLTPARGLGATLGLGTQAAFTLWSLINAEVVHDGSIMVTLKARGGLGALPDLSLVEVENDFKSAVQTNYNLALEAVHRETPGSVIDRVKDTMAVLINRWLVQHKHAPDTLLHEDIGNTVKALDPTKHYCLMRLGEVVGRLHARNKPNEQYRRGLPETRESDAELAIQCLTFVMYELGYATRAGVTP